jgi:hypothetical protein
MSSDPAQQGFMQHAGVLDENENIAPAAKARIIERLKKASNEGFAVASPFPCSAGSSVPTPKGLFPQDIEDEQKYPEFHKEIMTTYEKIAKGFNMKSAPNLPFPMCDPSALALQLGLDPPSFDLADMPSLTPVSLALQLKINLNLAPGLIDAFNIPPALPIPDFGIPTLSASINSLPDFAHKFEFDNWVIKTPALFAKFTGDLIANVDIPGILSLAAGQPCVIIDKVVEGETFGPSEEGDVVKQVVVADLSTFTGEMASIAAVGSTVGSSPTGATGILGEKYGYKEAQIVEGNKRHGRARNTIIEAYNIRYNRNPTPQEAQFTQAIASLENGYGSAFYDPIDTGKVNEKGLKIWKKGPRTPGSESCNNWGNIHGDGSAGSFIGYDFKSNGQPYQIKFAKYATPAQGCARLMQELFETRSYLLKCLRISKYAWNAVFLMSGRSKWGSNLEKIEAGKNVQPAADAVNPTGETYYAAPPSVYFNNFKIALKEINEEIGEEPAFDILKIPFNKMSLIGVTMEQINAVEL